MSLVDTESLRCYTTFSVFPQFLRKPIIIAALFVLVIILIGASLFFRKRDNGAASNNPLLPSAQSTSTPSQASGVAPAPTNLATPPTYRGQPVQLLNADGFASQVPAQNLASDRNELLQLAGKLEENPQDPPSWMRVAYIKHFYNDNVGARDAYEYLNIIASGDPIPFYNLALIYAYDLKDSERAIAKFRAALDRSPKDIIYHIGFADFYREVKKDFPAARSILLEGVGSTPSSDYYIALGSLERTMGDIPASIQYYEKALTFSELGKSERDSITREIEALKARAR